MQVHHFRIVVGLQELGYIADKLLFFLRKLEIHRPPTSRCIASHTGNGSCRHERLEANDMLFADRGQ